MEQLHYATAKLQNGVTVFGDFHQRNATTVTSKLG